MNIDDVRADIAAFADDAEDMVVEESGQVVFIRNGIDVNCGIEAGDASGFVVRMADGRRLPYSKFLTHELARLDAFAAKLLDRRTASQLFIDGEATISRPAEDDFTGSSMRILQEECESVPTFASRVTFVTADAGHGKTALLRHYQAKVAQDFVDGRSAFVFWHVDLQGRQLLRLSEALMGDLAEIRHSGLWMPGVVRLLRARKLILAVDGFDELSAEQGGSDALGALTGLVSQLEGQGVIVAAARRTFFDAEDYVRKTALMRRSMAKACQFDQLELEPWTERQAVEYLRGVEFEHKSFAKPTDTYAEILGSLGNNPAHPMLTRPFLLAQVAKAMLVSGSPASEFVRTATDLHSGVESVVNAFIKREVTEKWKSSTTGEPYLTGEQHMELLATVAEEMYRSQKERLGLDVIETLAVVLLDQWAIDPARRSQIIDMVKSHVLLVIPSDGDGSYRAFDHPEFRDYFVAYALRSYIESGLRSGETRQLLNFLSFASLTDGTARYVCAMVTREEPLVARLSSNLARQVAREWRPSHLHSNVGTLLAFLMADMRFPAVVEVDAALIYSSLVFEHASLQNVLIRRSNLVNVSLRSASWKGVTLEDCDINEVILDAETTHLENVSLLDCRIGCVRLVRGSEELSREYAPYRIQQALSRFGVATDRDQPALPTEDESQDSEVTRAARRFLRMFTRSTSVSEPMIEHRFKGGAVTALILQQVVPCAEKHGVIEGRTWKGSGNQRLWTLRQEIDVVLAAEEESAGPAHDFWGELHSLG